MDSGSPNDFSFGVLERVKDFKLITLTVNHTMKP